MVTITYDGREYEVGGNAYQLFDTIKGKVESSNPAEHWLVANLPGEAQKQVRLLLGQQIPIVIHG
jgi:hypothetical protein